MVRERTDSGSVHGTQLLSAEVGVANPTGTNIIQNGGFESSGAWVMESFERTDYISHSGAWSAGSFFATDGYFYQEVDVPANATSAILSYYWLNEDGDQGFDQLQVGIYDEFFEFIAAGPAHGSEDDSWHFSSLNFSDILDDIRGETIYVLFDVTQDAVEPDAVFYVDDVVFDVETGGGNPTPTAIVPPVPTPTPTRPSGPTPTPTTPPGGSGGTFRITLVWTDYPGEVEAARTLVNDLDLEVIAPDGSRFVGNQGTYTGGHCLRGSKWDACNNVEGIIIPNASHGTYTVVIHGANIPQGPQPFALAASGDGLREGGGSNQTPTPPGGIPLFLPVILTN